MQYHSKRRQLTDNSAGETVVEGIIFPKSHFGF